MKKNMTGAEIRQSFIDYFVEQNHTYVPSASLVPGGDATLLFTNAGMVQFKDVFLGTDKRQYSRAVNSQKCLRVAGKHNDLDEVGRDDSHHTFFEMLGNWSFGNYYKKEAISWAWQLLTDVWGLPREKLYVTCFKDELGLIPADEEAADVWRQQPGMDHSHILFFGRKENFWEMAETGPCGPCSEIHIDRGEAYDNLAGIPHKCGVNGECDRYLEIWNNVFIQYNRLDRETLEPLPEKHVDTGMGFERIVAVIQGVDSNYKIDLFKGALESIRRLTGDSQEEMYSNFTPYRVIADHARAASFLIADGVVPGNVGRNYVCRMIIRRAARFGSKLGLREPFLAEVARSFIHVYGGFYPELVKNSEAIEENLTREELRFSRTVDSGTAYLQDMLDGLKSSGAKELGGSKAFDLYATYGLPLEIARDIAVEQGLQVDEEGFKKAMEDHRLASGGGKAMGNLGGEDAEFYAGIRRQLCQLGKLAEEGVEHDPYDLLTSKGAVLALVMDDKSIEKAGAGDQVEVIIPRTGFYVESGGQVSDTGVIRAVDGTWEIDIVGMRKPASGIIVHVGEVVFGHPQVGDQALAMVDSDRRHDIRRNHTATHLLHSALHKVLGEKARQAGSSVTQERFRFDFNHHQAMSDEQIEEVEKLVNEAIAADFQVNAISKPRNQAESEGAMALFGEKYGDTVRTIAIGDDENRYSYELCGGTHLDRTSDAGLFLIVSESSVAAGVRRIEAVTGRGAYKLAAKRSRLLKRVAASLKSGIDDIPEKIDQLQDELNNTRRQAALLKVDLAKISFQKQLASARQANGIWVLSMELPGLDKEILTHLSDDFREVYKQKGVCVIGSVNDGGQILVMAAVTDDLIKKGIKAGELVNMISQKLGAGGGGSPHLAFGGGRDADKLAEVLSSVESWVLKKIG